MKLKKILALLTILLLTLTACKSTEEPKPDPLKLSERVGVYTGSVEKSDGTTSYGIVVIENDGSVLCNSTSSVNPSGYPTQPKLDINSTDTIFNLENEGGGINYKITFTSKTTLIFYNESLDRTINLTKEK